MAPIFGRQMLDIAHHDFQPIGFVLELRCGLQIFDSALEGGPPGVLREILLAAALGFLKASPAPRPAGWFQIATQRSTGQSVANCVRSSELAEGWAPAAIMASGWSGPANAVMLFSVSR